MEVSLLDVQFL